MLLSGHEGPRAQVEVTWCAASGQIWLFGALKPVPVYPGDVLVGYDAARHDGTFVPLDFARRPHRV